MTSTSENNHTPEKKPVSGKQRMKNFFRLGEVGGYFFRGKDPSRPSNFNIKVMHGINRISIIVFLLGILYILLRRLF